MNGKYHIDDVHVSTFEAVDTRFLFRTGAADAAIVKAFMNPALSIATASENKNREQMTTSIKRIGF